MRNAKSYTLSPANNPMPAFHFLSRLRKKDLASVRNQHGVTYLALMFVVVLIGLSLMAVNQHWSVILKRDREKELAFRGDRIKAAIERYAADFEVQKSTRQNQYPLNLEVLTKRPKRYLQVVYKDPLTGEEGMKFAESGVRVWIRHWIEPSFKEPKRITRSVLKQQSRVAQPKQREKRKGHLKKNHPLRCRPLRDTIRIRTHRLASPWPGRPIAGTFPDSTPTRVPKVVASYKY